MRKAKSIQIILSLVVILMLSVNLNAGNEQRGGSSGASEILINPWARTSGFGNANVSCVNGLEGVFLNVAGLAHVQKTELVFTNSQYLVGSGISINSFGFGQKVGEVGVLGVSVMSMNFGEIERTTADLPEGGIGSFKPSYSVINVSYAREFSNSIYGGFTAKIINESIYNLSASGFALDAGIQYVTGFGKDKADNRKRDNIRFGITMQNVGTTMQYAGEGMTFFGLAQNGTEMTVEHRSQSFELPSLIRLGFSYHIMLAPVVDEAESIVNSDHNLIIAAAFTSNSFTRDQIHVGLEYGFKNYFYLRGGYMYEDGITTVNNRLTAFTGPTAGMTMNIPTNKEGSSVIGIDYSYRFTNPFGGVHTFGARITL